MTDPLSDPQLAGRVRDLLADAVANLDPADRDERIAWCRANDAHGIRMRADDGLLEFSWGGRTLAMVRAADLADDVPLRAEFVPNEVPDTVPGEWAEN